MSLAVGLIGRDDGHLAHRRLRSCSRRLARPRRSCRGALAVRASAGAVGSSGHRQRMFARTAPGTLRCCGAGNCRRTRRSAGWQRVLAWAARPPSDARLGVRQRRVASQQDLRRRLVLARPARSSPDWHSVVCGRARVPVEVGASATRLCWGRAFQLSFQPGVVQESTYEHALDLAHRARELELRAPDDACTRAHEALRTVWLRLECGAVRGVVRRAWLVAVDACVHGSVERRTSSSACLAGGAKR